MLEQNDSFPEIKLRPNSLESAGAGRVEGPSSMSHEPVSLTVGLHLEFRLLSIILSQRMMTRCALSL